MRTFALTLVFCLTALPVQAHQSVHFGGYGDVPYWEDLRIPGLVTTRASDAPDVVTFGGSGNLVCLGFAGTGVLVEQVYFAAQTSHTMKLGSTLEPHVHWSPTTADAGDVVWTLEYDIAKVNGTFDGPTTITCTTDSTNSSAWDHLIADCGQITTEYDDGVSLMIMGRLARDPADANDTYAADACLAEIDFHFEVDSHGSLGEFSKMGNTVAPSFASIAETGSILMGSGDKILMGTGDEILRGGL